MSSSSGVAQPSEDAPFVEAIKAYLDNLQRTDICAWIFDVRVASDTPLKPSSVPIPSLEGFQVKEFTLEVKPCFHPIRTSESVPLGACAVASNSEDIEIRDLLVGVPDRWIPLGCWMDKQDVESDEHGSYEIQNKWWKMTEKVFSFLELPGELRNQIYECAVGRDIYPCLNDSRYIRGSGEPAVEDVNLLGRGLPGAIASHRDRQYHDQPTKADPPNKGLMLANKKVFHESFEIGWKKSRKIFLDSGAFGAFYFTDGLIKYNLSNFTHIKLDFSTDDFMYFFGLPTPKWAQSRQPSAQCLSATRMPHLRHLELNFQSTKHGIRTDPYLWRKWPANSREALRQPTACHKTVVDWILTAAKIWIQHIPHVELTGYIKTSVKNKWDKILDDERNGIHYDLSTELRDIMRTPKHNWPPKCHCSTPCAFEGLITILSRDTCFCGPHQICAGAKTPTTAQERVEIMNSYVFDFDD